jgi:hypothetical protein
VSVVQTQNYPFSSHRTICWSLKCTGGWPICHTLVCACLLGSNLNVLDKPKKTQGITRYFWHLNLSATNSVFSSIKCLSCFTELIFIPNLISVSHLGYNFNLMERNVMPLVSVCERCNDSIFHCIEQNQNLESYKFWSKYCTEFLSCTSPYVGRVAQSV